MRKLSACLTAALLSVAPASALAGPTNPPWADVQARESNGSHQRLGIMVMSLNTELRTHFGASADRGVLAAKAGVRVGDVLVAVRGEPVRDAGDVMSALSATKQGDSIKIDVVRDKKPMTLDGTATTSSSARAELQWLQQLFPFLGSLRS
jgi:S1-C subfamily serine protease